MPKYRKLNRLNRFSIGRPAVLFLKGKTEKEVFDYLFARYGKEWGISTRERFEKYMRGSKRPNLKLMFEEKSREKVLARFRTWLENKKKLEARDDRRHTKEMIPADWEKWFFDKGPRIEKTLLQKVFDDRMRELGMAPTRSEMQKRSAAAKRVARMEILNDGRKPEWDVVRGKERRVQRVMTVVDNPIETMVKSERTRRVAEAVSQLSPAERELINAVYFGSRGGLAGAARKNGLTITRAKRVIESARAKMARHLRNVA